VKTAANEVTCFQCTIAESHSENKEGLEKLREACGVTKINLYFVVPHRYSEFKGLV